MPRKISKVKPGKTPGKTSRKSEHLDICLKEDIGFRKSALWGDIELLHSAVPEISLEKIDTSVMFFDKKLDAPLIIASMTGGTPAAERINKALASVAQKFNIAFSVGSQRPAILDNTLERTYKVRDVAPDILLLANLGLIQFVKDFKPEAARQAVEMIGADGICLHLNAAQEAVQAEGDTNFEGALSKMREIADLNLRVVAKETGCGISRRVAQRLIDSGASAIDVGGAGGTSWTAVESYRNTGLKKTLGETFWDWGIPTAASVMLCSDLGVPVIATGGIRNGLQAAKAIALGADCCGIALPALKIYSSEGTKGLEKYVQTLIEEMKLAMFLTGSRNIEGMQNSEKIVTGRLKDWVEYRIRKQP